MDGSIRRTAESERKPERENCVGIGGRVPHVLETSECSVVTMLYALMVPAGGHRSARCLHFDASAGDGFEAEASKQTMVFSR